MVHRTDPATGAKSSLFTRQRIGRWSVLAAAGLVALTLGGAGISVAAQPPPGAPPPQPVVVKNSTAEPVPVAVGNLPETLTVSGTVDVANLPDPTPPPLWQGTPYLNDARLGGAPGCQTLPIPAGMILFVERATTGYSVPEGESGHNQWLNLTLPGSTVAKDVFIPTFSTGPRLGNDSYMGSIDIGLPATEAKACGAEAVVTVMGYLVPAP